MARFLPPVALLCALRFLWGWFRDPIDVVLRPYNEHAVRDRGGRHAHLAHGVRRQELEARAGLDDVNVTLLAREVEPAVGGDGGGGETGAAVSESLAVDDADSDDARLTESLSRLGWHVSGRQSGISTLPVACSMANLMAL